MKKEISVAWSSLVNGNWNGNALSPRHLLTELCSEQRSYTEPDKMVASVCGFNKGYQNRR